MLSKEGQKLKVENLSLMGCNSGNHYYFTKILEALDTWRNADHEDRIILSRHEICTILDGIKQIRGEDTI